MPKKKITKSKKKSAPKQHHFWRKVLVIALIAIGLILVIYIVAFWLVQPPRPGKFYETPENIPGQPGQLIHSETADNADVKNANTDRILYSSRGIHDEPIVVSGMVFAPDGSVPEDGFPVVAWAHGTSGVARQCAPSLSPERATDFIMGIQELIDDGYMVVVTDYPGLGTEGPHPYLISKSEAQAVLDSVRAVQQLSGSSRYVIWGHSQGGHAALSATQYAASYAPELELLGTAAAAPATNLAALLEDDITTPVGKVFGSYALHNWSKLFDDAKLSDIIKKPDLPLVETIAADCLGTKDQGLVILPEVELMSRDFTTGDPAKLEPWATIIRDNSVAPKGIPTPILIAQGTADTVIHPPVTRNWISAICTHNQTTTLNEYQGKDHLSVVTAAVSDFLHWTKDRFADQPASGNCQ